MTGKLSHRGNQLNTNSCCNLAWKQKIVLLTSCDSVLPMAIILFLNQSREHKKLAFKFDADSS